MKNLPILLSMILLLSCNGKQGVYWCGDHQCINKKEKEAYFKKTMIVEVKDLKNVNIKKSEFDKILLQAKLNEKKRIENEKDLAKQKKLEKKERIKKEKQLKKQAKLKEKQSIKKEKRLAKIVKQKVKKIPKKNVKNNEGIESFQKVKLSKFDELLDKMIKKNSLKSYPDINNMPN
tara:strand:- start:1851 stop:2378 length:528 start_codon:yes stop_codon:yes gene_type:complete